MEDCSNIIVKPFESKSPNHLTELTIFISLPKKLPGVIQLLTSELEKEMKIHCRFINNNVNFAFKFKDIEMEFRPELVDKTPFG
jgi:hypothetical protein